MYILIEILGWIGALAVIVAFLLNSIKKLRSESPTYLLLNLTGGLLLVINTLYKAAYPSAFVNVVWVIIALYALLTKRIR